MPASGRCELKLVLLPASLSDPFRMIGNPKTPPLLQAHSSSPANNHFPFSPCGGHTGALLPETMPPGVRRIPGTGRDLAGNRERRALGEGGGEQR